MNTQEAVQALLRAGKGDQMRGMIREAVQAASVAYDRIRSETGFTDEHRTSLLADRYLMHREQLDKKLSDAAAQASVQDRDDASRVFGIKGLPGDPASLAISRRDAGDRVAQITSGPELRELLRRATRGGDEVLARAVAERAVETGDAETMHEFVATRPGLDAAAERVWNAEQAGSRVFEVSLEMTAMRPPELLSIPSTEIERLARA